jgi:hypothetical protein
MDIVISLNTLHQLHGSKSFLKVGIHRFLNIQAISLPLCIFFNSKRVGGGGGVQLGPFGTSATNCPILPAPGDYDDGEFGRTMIGRGNRSTRRKPVQCHFVHHKSHMTSPGANSGRQGGKPATNRLSYGTAFPYVT